MYRNSRWFSNFNNVDRIGPICLSLILLPQVVHNWTMCVFAIHRYFWRRIFLSFYIFKQHYFHVCTKFIPTLSYYIHKTTKRFLLSESLCLWGIITSWLVFSFHSHKFFIHTSLSIPPQLLYAFLTTNM